MRNQLILSISVILAFFIILFAYIKLAGPIPFSVNSVTTQKTDTFSVSGEGEVSVSPDLALVTVGVSASADTLKQAQDQMNQTINKVSDAVKKLGVEDRDIQTTNYNITPTYDFREGGQRITGYSGSTNLTIKVRNLDRVNSVIDASTSQGANQVGGVSFDIEDRTKAENQAREKAVEEAKSRAENAARIAGFKLGRIINYQENFGGLPRPIPLLSQGAVSKDSVPTQIEPGSQIVTVIVTLSYEIR